MVFQFIVGQLSIMLIGYAFFRVTSDVEKLPFPMAPIGAQGVMALAEDVEKKEAAAGERPWRWRVFAIGGAIGLAFGAVYLLLPTLTGGLTGKPVMLLPIPFSDFTVKTQSYLPAVATGMAWNLGDLIVGMVLPFWAMVGSLIGLFMSMAANPILYHAGVLSSWTPGDDTITTLFKNNVDFYFSFGIGISVAIAIVGIMQAVRAFLRSARARKAAGRDRRPASIPKGRGDFRLWIVIAGYTLLTLSYILLSGWLVHWHKGVMLVLVLIGFVYTPLIGYVTTRLEGIAGQVVEIPMVREAGMILSGFRGIQVWFLPTASSSMSQISGMTVFYRQCELTGTSFRSIWKSVVALFPVILICTVLFSSFIWGLAELPSVVYPYSQKMWELSAANSCVVYSSTTGDYSIFEDAFKWKNVFVGTGLRRDDLRRSHPARRADLPGLRSRARARPEPAAHHHPAVHRRADRTVLLQEEARPEVAAIRARRRRRLRLRHGAGGHRRRRDHVPEQGGRRAAVLVRRPGNKLRNARSFCYEAIPQVRRPENP